MVKIYKEGGPQYHCGPFASGVLVISASAETRVVSLIACITGFAEK